jgi:putative ABC transport system substrate-binding protein
MSTGTSMLDQETWAKALEVLRLVRPEASTFAALPQADNPGNPTFRRQLDHTASQLGIKLHVLELKEASGLPEAFRQMILLGAQGVYINPDTVLGSHRAEIVELARQHKLPTVSDGSFANEGGLVAFVVNYPTLAKRSAWYVDQILKGAAPAG